MRDESQKSKQAKMDEDLEKANHHVEDLKRSLAEKRKLVKPLNTMIVMRLSQYYNFDLNKKNFKRLSFGKIK